MNPRLALALTLVLAAVAAPAQETAAPADDPARTSFMDYNPPSTLKVPEHPVERARHPFVDVHNHQFDLDEPKLRELLTALRS